MIWNPWRRIRELETLIEHNNDSFMDLLGACRRKYSELAAIHAMRRDRTIRGNATKRAKVHAMTQRLREGL